MGNAISVKCKTYRMVNKTNVAKRKVAARLRTKTAFAAFKRDYIRAHQSEYPEFQEYV